MWDLFLGSINKKKRHFIGNVVVKQNIEKKYELIDGQQRLTTLLLIVKALTTKYAKDTNNQLYHDLKSIF
jgi:uncharacterized protein with ParB-like and HNH nuclease domain